jgi:hypothetical protein
LNDLVGGPIEEVNELPNTEYEQKELECGQNYEDLCRKHVVCFIFVMFYHFFVSTQFSLLLVKENYFTATEQYIRESELSKRVQEWSEKLEPFLREQVNNNAQTIHIETLSKTSHKQKTFHH